MNKQDKLDRAYSFGLKSAKNSFTRIPDWVLTDPECLSHYQGGFDDQKIKLEEHREVMRHKTEMHEDASREEITEAFGPDITLYAVTRDPMDVVLNINRGTRVDSPFGLPVFKDEDEAMNHASRQRLGVFSFKIVPQYWEMFDDDAPIGSPEQIERLIEFKTRDIKAYYTNLKNIDAVDHSVADIAIKDYESMFKRLYEESYSAFADDWMASGLSEVSHPREGLAQEYLDDDGGTLLEGN